MKVILIYILVIVILFLFYSVFSTIFIRTLSKRLIKVVPNTDGIFLTFDDGPHPVYTPQLLDLLKSSDIRATFFVVGSLAAQYPHIIERMNREGHTIGIHHHQHQSSWLLSPRQLKKQLTDTNQVLYTITHEQTVFYRPPWGHFNIASLFVSKPYTIIMWSHIFQDWKVTKHQLNKLKQFPSNGSIILLHDNGDTKGADQEAPKVMMSYLAPFIERCKERGTQFLTF